MGMSERIRKIYDWSGKSAADLERETGLSRYKWSGLFNERQRVNEEHLEAIDKLWPQFSYWVMTGRVQPEAGNISPEIESARIHCEQTQKAG